MLARTLRKSINTKISIAPLAQRGGGFPRPDTPPIHVEGSKRRWSMYENGLWLNDGAQPEFAFENREEWFSRYGSVRNQMMFHFITMWACGIAGGLLFYFILPGDVHQTNGDNANDNHFYDSVMYQVTEQPGKKKDFLGTTMNHSEGAWVKKYEIDNMGGLMYRTNEQSVKKATVVEDCRKFADTVSAIALANAKAKLESGAVGHH